MKRRHLDQLIALLMIILIVDTPLVQGAATASTPAAGAGALAKTPEQVKQELTDKKEVKVENNIDSVNKALKETGEIHKDSKIDVPPEGNVERTSTGVRITAGTAEVNLDKGAKATVKMQQTLTGKLVAGAVGLVKDYNLAQTSAGQKVAAIADLVGFSGSFEEGMTAAVGLLGGQTHTTEVESETRSGKKTKRKISGGKTTVTRKGDVKVKTDKGEQETDITDFEEGTVIGGNTAIDKKNNAIASFQGQNVELSTAPDGSLRISGKGGKVSAYISVEDKYGEKGSSGTLRGTATTTDDTGWITIGHKNGETVISGQKATFVSTPNEKDIANYKPWSVSADDFSVKIDNHNQLSEARFKNGYLEPNPGRKITDSVPPLNNDYVQYFAKGTRELALNQQYSKVIIDESMWKGAVKDEFFRNGQGGEKDIIEGKQNGFFVTAKTIKPDPNEPGSKVSRRYFIENIDPKSKAGFLGFVTSEVYIPGKDGKSMMADGKPTSIKWGALMVKGKDGTLKPHVALMDESINTAALFKKNPSSIAPNVGVEFGPWKVDADKSGIMAASETKRGRQYGLFLANDALTAKTTEWRAEYTRREDAAIAAKQAALKALEGGGFTSAQIKEAQQIFAKLGVKKTAEDLKVMYYLDKKDAKSAADIATSRDNRRMVADAFSQSTDPSQQKTAMSMWGDLAKTAATEREGEELRRNILNLDGRLTGKTTFGQVDTLADEIAQGRANSKEYYKNDLEGSIRLMDANQRLADAVNFQGVDTEKRREADYISEIRSGGDAKAKTYELAVASDRIGLEQDAKDNYDLVRSHPDYYGGTNSDIVKNANARSKVIGDHLEQVVARQQAQLPAEELKKLGKSELEKIAKTLSGGSHSNEMRILGELYERRGQHDLAKQTYELGLVSSDLGAGSAAEKSLGQGRQTAMINTAVEQLPRLIQSNDFKGARALIEGISNDQKQKMEEYINNAENTKNTQDLIKNGNFAEAEATAKKITDAKTRETLLFRTYALSNDLTKLTESTSSFKDAGARDAAYDYLATTYEQRGLRASAEGLIDKIAGISPEEKALRKAMMYAGTDVSKKEHFLKQAEAILTREGAQNKEEYNMNMARYSALIGRNKDVVDSWYAAAIGDLQKAKQGATPEIIARLTEQEKSFTKEVQTLRAMDTNTRISEYTKKFSELGSQRETLRNQEGYLWNSEEIRNKVNTVNQKTAEAQKEYAAYFSTLSSAYIGLERWRIENGQYPDTPQIKQMKLDALKAAEESQRIMNKWASIPEITYRPEEIALNELTARGRELTTGIFLSNEIDGINKVQNDLTKALLEKQYGDRYAQYKLAENGGDIQKTLAAVRDDKTKFDQQLKNPYMDDIGRNNIRTFQTIVGNSLGTLEVATKPDLKVDSQTFSYLSAMRGNEINTVSRFKELNQIPLTDIERPMVDQQIYQLKASQDALSAKMYERLDTYTPTVRASIDKMTATTSVAAGVVKNNEITSFDKGLWGTGIRRFTDNLLQGSIGQAFESLADVSLASTYWSLGSDYDSTYSTYNKAFTDTIQSSKAARQLNEIAQMYPGVDIYDSKNLGKLTPEQQWIVQESIFKTKPQSIEEAYGGKSDSTYYTSGEAWKGATNLGNLGKVAASMAVAAVTTGGLGWLAGAIGLTKNVGTTTTAAANFLTNAFAFTVADEAINQIATGRYDASKFADTEFGTKLATNLVTFGAMHALGSATKPLSSYISGEGKAAIEAASKATTQPGGKAATAVIEAATKPISLPRSILAKSTEIGLTSAGMGAVFGTAEYVQRRLNGEILTAEDILTGYGSAALNGLIFTSLHQAATTAVTTAGTKVSSYLTEKALSSSAENVIKTATQFATKIGLDLRDPNKVADTLARAKLQQEGISAPTQEQVALAKSSIPKETINRATNPTASPVERAEPLRQIGRYLARTIAESQITEAEVLQKAKTLDNRGVGLEKMPETERAGLIERARQGLVEERIRNDLSRAKGNDALESQVRKGLTDAIEQEAAKPGEAILPWSDITDYQMAEAQYRKLTGQAELSSIDQKMFTLRGALPEEAFKKIIESSDYQGWIARQKTIEMDILSARQTLGELRTTAEALKGPEATSTKKPPLQDSTAYKDARVALEPTRLGTERMVLTNELSEARTSATDAQRELERLGSLADKPIENEAAFKEQAQSRGMTSEEARQEATRQATQRLEEANTKKTQLEAQLKENGDNILTANLEKAILQSPDSAVPVAAEARATSILAEITRVNQEKQRLSQTETSAKERARQLGEYERALNEALLKAHEQLNRAKAAVDSESPGVLDLLGRGGAYLTSRENLLKTKNELETAQARKIFSEDLIKRVEDAKKSRQIPNVEEIARKLAQESTDSRYARFANDAAEGIAKKAMTAEQTIESARSAAAERLDEAETRYKLAVKQFAEGQKQLLFDDNALAAQARMADAQMNAESTKAMLEKAKTAMSMAETNSIIQAMDLAMLIGDPQIKGILENINGISMLETGRSEAETVKAKDLRREEINRIVNEKMTGIEAAPGSAEHQAKLETEIKAAEAATAGKLTEYSQQAKQKVQEALQMMKAEAAQSTQKIRTADAKKTLEDIVKAEASKGNHAQIADTVRRETGLSNQDLVKLMGSERGKAPVIEERILEDREYSAQEKDSLERRVNEIEMKRKYSPLTIEETLELYRADKQARLLRLIDAKQQEVSDLVSSQGRQEGETATILEARISKARNELADLRTKKEASIKTSNEKLNLLQTLELRGWEYMTNKMGAGGRLANFDPFQVEAESIAYAQHLMGASTAMAGGKSSFVGPGILETSRSTLGMKGVFLTTQGLAFAQNQIMAEKFAMLGRKVYFLDGLDKLADRLTKTQEADFVVVGDQTIGFLLTKLWDPNTPVNERLAAKGIIGELTTNRHIFADEADSVWKPKNRYISGGKQTSPPVEKLAIASSVNTIFERMGLYVLDKNGNEAYRAKIVDGSEQTSIKTIASATSLPESEIIRFLENRNSIIREGFSDRSLSEAGSKLNAEQARKIYDAFTALKEKTKFKQEFYDELATRVATETGLTTGQVKEIFRNPNKANWNDAKVAKAIEYLEAINEFGDFMGKYKGHDYFYLESEQRIIPGKSGAPQKDQRYSNAYTALAAEYVGAKAYGQKANTEAVKVSGKAVEASLPQFYTMAERGGSFVTSMTGDPGAAEATMSLTLGMKWSASDVITKKLFGTDTKAGDWLERGLLRVTGVGANRADALDWIVSNAKTLERSGGVENKNKVYAIVSLLKGLENREISEKLTKDPRFEHITTVIESGTAELGTWTIRTKSGEVWSEKKISEAEFAEYKRRFANGEMKNTLIILGEGASRGTDIPMLRDIPWIAIGETESIKSEAQQMITRAGRVPGEEPTIHLIVSGGAKITAAELRRSMESAESYANRANAVEGAISALDGIGNDFFNQYSVRNMMGADSTAFRVNEALRDTFKGTAGKNLEITPGLESIKDSIKKKIDSAVQFWKEIQELRENPDKINDPKYAKIKNALKETLSDEISKGGDTPQVYRDALKRYFDSLSAGEEARAKALAVNPGELKTRTGDVTAGKPLFGATDYVEWADTFSKTFSEKDLPAVRSGKTAEAAIVMPAAEARLRQKKIALDEIIPLAERAEQSADAQRAAREEITRIMPEREAPAVQIAPTITSTWSSSYLSPALTRAAGYASAIGLYGVGTTLSNAASAASAATTETSATLLTALSHASTDPATLGVAILTAATAIAWTPLRNAATAFLKPTAETIAEGLESPNEALRQAAQNKLTKMGNVGARAAAKKLASKNSQTREQAYELLMQFGQTANGAEQQIMDAVTDPTETIDNKQRGIQALQSMKTTQSINTLKRIVDGTNKEAAYMAKLALEVMGIDETPVKADFPVEANKEQTAARPENQIAAGESVTIRGSTRTIERAKERLEKENIEIKIGQRTISIIKDENDGQIKILSEGKSLTLNPGDSITAGRDPQNTIDISDSQVSRNHLRINYDKESDLITITDLQSSNGSTITSKIETKALTTEEKTKTLAPEEKSVIGLYTRVSDAIYSPVEQMPKISQDEIIIDSTFGDPKKAYDKLKQTGLLPDIKIVAEGSEYLISPPFLLKGVRPAHIVFVKTPGNYKYHMQVAYRSNSASTYRLLPWIARYPIKGKETDWYVKGIMIPQGSDRPTSADENMLNYPFVITHEMNKRLLREKSIQAEPPLPVITSLSPYGGTFLPQGIETLKGLSKEVRTETFDIKNDPPIDIGTQSQPEIDFVIRDAEIAFGRNAMQLFIRSKSGQKIYRFVQAEYLVQDAATGKKRFITKTSLAGIEEIGNGVNDYGLRHKQIAQSNPILNIGGIEYDSQLQEFLYEHPVRGARQERVLEQLPDGTTKPTPYTAVPNELEPLIQQADQFFKKYGRRKEPEGPLSSISISQEESPAESRPTAELYEQISTAVQQPTKEPKDDAIEALDKAARDALKQGDEAAQNAIRTLTRINTRMSANTIIKLLEDKISDATIIKILTEETSGLKPYALSEEMERVKNLGVLPKLTSESADTQKEAVRFLGVNGNGLDLPRLTELKTTTQDPELSRIIKESIDSIRGRMVELSLQSLPAGIRTRISMKDDSTTDMIIGKYDLTKNQIIGQVGGERKILNSNEIKKIQIEGEDYMILGERRTFKTKNKYVTLPIHPDIDIVPELKEFGKVRAPSAKPTEPERAPARLIEGVISAASNIPVIGIAAGIFGLPGLAEAGQAMSTAAQAAASAIQVVPDSPGMMMATLAGGLLFAAGRRIYNRYFAAPVVELPTGPPITITIHGIDGRERSVTFEQFTAKNPIDINPIIDALSSEDTWPEAARLITDAFQEEGHETGIIRGANGEIIVHLKETLPAIETANALEKQTGIKTNCGTGSTNCAGHETKDEIELLIGKMGSGDPEEVKIVSDQLTRLGAVAVPSLILGAKNPNILIRESSLVVLGNIGGNPAISTLLDAINDKDDKVRLTAALALMKIDPSVIEGMGGNFLKVTLTLIDILARTPEENKQKILTRVTSLGEPVVPYFIVALSARNPDYAFEAYHSLIAIGKPAVSPLKSLFLNKNSGIRDTAVLALGEIGAQSEADESQRSGPPYTIRLASEIRVFLEDNLDDFDPGEVRGAVLYTLGQLKLNTWTVIDQMLNGLTRSDPYVRIMAARGLGELGNKHPTILNALIRYMDEGTFMFEGSINDRNAAVKSIGKLGVDILPDIIGKYLKASDEKSRHNLFLVMIAIKNLNPDKKERIFEVIRQSGLPQNFKELWNELSANDYALINEYSELISSQGTSRTGLENAIDTGLPVKRSSRSDGHYKDDDFSKQKDLLSLTTLIVLSELIHYLHTGQGKSDLGQIISRDLLDWGSEAGGLVVYKNGKLSFERYEPRCRGDNCRYIISEKLDADSPHALFSWHNHATKLLGNAEIAGPSGWHSAQDVSGGGDIGTAEQENKDGVVITYLGENKFNVNYYTYDGIVINLGDYSWDTSKVPLLTKEKIGELEKVYSENVVRRSDVIDNELERLLITTKNDCDSGAIPGAACSAMQTALETTNYDDKVNKIIMAQSALATPSIVAPDISKPPTDAEKSLNQKFGTLINKAQRPLDESVLEETLAARDYTTPQTMPEETAAPEVTTQPVTELLTGLPGLVEAGQITSSTMQTAPDSPLAVMATVTAGLAITAGRSIYNYFSPIGDTAGSRTARIGMIAAGALLAAPATAWAGQMLMSSPDMAISIAQTSTNPPALAASMLMGALGTLIGTVFGGYKIPPSPIRHVNKRIGPGDRYWNPTASESNVDTLRAQNDQGELLAAIIKTGEIGELVTAYASVDETGQITALTARKEELPPADIHLSIVWDGQLERYTGVEALTALTSADQSKIVDDIATAAAQANTMMEKKGGASILALVPTIEAKERSIATAIAAGAVETARSVKINFAVEGFSGPQIVRDSSRRYLISQWPSSEPALIRGLSALKPAAVIESAAILGEMRSKAAVPRLGQIASDPKRWANTNAIEALAKIDTPEAQEQIINAMNNAQGPKYKARRMFDATQLSKTTPNPQTHERALNTLIKEYDADAKTDTMIQTAKIIRNYVKEAEKHGLKSPSAIKYLKDRLLTESAQSFYWVDIHISDQIALIITLGEIGPQAEPATEKILSWIEGAIASGGVYYQDLDSAYEAIGAIKPQSKQDIDRIRDMILKNQNVYGDRKSTDLIKGLIPALGKIGKAATPTLLKLLRPQTLPEHSELVKRSLVSIGADAVAQIIPEIATVESEIANLKRQIGRYPTDIYLSVRASDLQTAKISLIDVLGLMKNQAKGAIDLLKTQLEQSKKSGNVDLNKHIIQAIGEIAPEEAIDSLIDTIKTQEKLKQLAIEQIGKIGQNEQTPKTREAATKATQPLIDVIKQSLDRSTEEGPPPGREYTIPAIESLGKISTQSEKKQQIIEFLTKALDESNKAHNTALAKENYAILEIQATVISALSEGGKDAKAAIPTIIDAIETASSRFETEPHSGSLVINAAASAIPKIGSDSRTAAAIERELAKNEDWKIPASEIGRARLEMARQANSEALRKALSDLAQKGDINAAMAIHDETALMNAGDEAVKALLERVYQINKDTREPLKAQWEVEMIAKIGTEQAVASLKELIRGDDGLANLAFYSARVHAIRDIEPAALASVSRNLGAKEDTPQAQARSGAIVYLVLMGSEEAAKELTDMMLREEGESRVKTQLKNAADTIREDARRESDIRSQEELSKKKALALADRFSKKDGITGCAGGECIETDGIAAQIRQMTEAGHISELMDYLESLSEEMGNFERSVGIKQEIRPEIDDTLTDLETTRVMVETHTKQLQKEFSLSDGQQKKMMLMYLASPEDLRSQLISFWHDILNPMNIVTGYTYMLREDKETQKLLERELTIQTNKLNELVEMVRSGKEWDFSKQSRPGLLLLYAHQIQALNEILTRNYLAIQPYRKELSGKQQNTLDSILDGNLKTKNAIVYLTEFEPKEIKEQISESAREFGLDTFEIGENVKDTETQASITKSLQNFAANSKRAMDTYNQNARLKGEPTRTLKNSVKADYDPSTKEIEVTYQDNAGGIDIETVRKNLEKKWKTISEVRQKLRDIGIFAADSPQDQLTDYEVIHSILLKGVTTKVEEEGEHGIGLFGVVEEMKHSGGWTTKIDWKTKETAAKYKPPVSIEQVKDPDGNVIGTKFTLRMKSTDTPRFLLEYPRTMIAKMRAIEPESIVQEALVESAMQTEAGNPMTPMEVATAKLQARLESLGLQGKKLEDALSKKLEEVQRVMPEQAEPESARFKPIEKTELIKTNLDKYLTKATGRTLETLQELIQTDEQGNVFFIDADGKPHIEITQYVGDLISNLLDRIALKMLIGEKDEAKAYALKLADIVDAMISQVETGSAIGILKDHVEAAQKTETYNLMKEAWYANKDKLLAEQTEDTLKPIQDALLKYKKEVSNTYTYSESYPAAADALAKRLAEMQTIPPAQAETSVAIAPTVSEKVPKTNSRGYIPMRDVIAKGGAEQHKMTLQVSGNRLLVDGKPVQGITIKGDMATITGEQYTSWESAMAFARNEAIPPGVDGFTYVAEPGRMAGNTQDEIKKTLGAASTEAVIKIRFIAPIEKIWVKSEKAKPFKLAVEEGIDTYLISDMDVVDLREKPQDQEAIARLGAATSGFMIDYDFEVGIPEEVL